MESKILAALERIERKLDALLNALAEDGVEAPEFDLEGNVIDQEVNRDMML